MRVLSFQRKKLKNDRFLSNYCLLFQLLVRKNPSTLMHQHRDLSASKFLVKDVHLHLELYVVQYHSHTSRPSIPRIANTSDTGHFFFYTSDLS